MTTTKQLKAKTSPKGFYAVEKEGVNYPAFDNVCRYCDARPLCQENIDEWCKNNPCMSYSRPDGLSVVFKK